MDNNLLEKYWNAETTPQEEEQIRNDLAGTQSVEAAYFAMITESRKQKSRLSIDDIRAFSQQSKEAIPVKRIIPLYRWIASAAAILVFVASGVGLWKYSQQATQPVQMAETFDDPYKAYEEMREALAFVSAKLNKSQSEAMINIKKAGEYADMFK
jgi:hypothetical protein